VFPHPFAVHDRGLDYGDCSDLLPCVWLESGASWVEANPFLWLFGWMMGGLGWLQGGIFL